MNLILPFAVLPAAVGAPGRSPACSSAAAIAVLVWWVFRVLQSDDLAQGAEWRYDVSRINELRRIDPLYRLFQPVFSVLARMNRVLFPERLPEINREIQAAGLPRFWLPEEYLAQDATLRAAFHAAVDLRPRLGLRHAGPDARARGGHRHGVASSAIAWPRKPPGGCGRSSAACLSCWTC